MSVPPSNEGGSERQWLEGLRPEDVDAEAGLDWMDRCRAMEAALKQIAAEPMRLHPIAGYMFDVDVRKIANEALNEAGSP